MFGCEVLPLWLFPFHRTISSFPDPSGWHVFGLSSAPMGIDTFLPQTALCKRLVILL